MSRERLFATLLVAAPLGACDNSPRFEGGGDVLQVCDVRLSPAENAVRIERYVEELRVIEGNNSSMSVGDGAYSRLEGPSLSIPMLVERERGCTPADWAAARELLSQTR